MAPIDSRTPPDKPVYDRSERYRAKACTWSRRVTVGGASFTRECMNLATHVVAPGLCLCKDHNAEYGQRYLAITGGADRLEKPDRAQSQALRKLWDDAYGEPVGKDMVARIVQALYRGAEKDFDLPAPETLDEMAARIEKQEKLRRPTVEVRQEETEVVMSRPYSRAMGKALLRGQESLIGDDAVDW